MTDDSALDGFLAGLQEQLQALSEAIRDQYQQARPARGRCSYGGVGDDGEYRIEHTTTYTYDAEVTGSYGQFHLRPRTCPGRPAWPTRSSSTRSRRTCSGTPTCTATPSPTST